MIISPSEFLALCPKIERDIKVEEYKRLMLRGVEFPYARLWYDDDGIWDHDGRHRAMAADEIGVEKMNVDLIYEKRT